MAALEKKLKAHIRWLIGCDLYDVTQIEKDVFEYPWSRQTFENSLRQRNCIGMVAEHCEHIVGYFLYELHEKRIHILNFAVARNRWGQGVGRQMLDKLIDKLSPNKRVRITLEVRETNLNALLFFKACGFKATQVLRDYYDESPEDAIVMQWHINDQAMNG